MCYEYQYVVSGVLVYDSVEMVAGKVAQESTTKKLQMTQNSLFFFSV